MPDFKGQTPSFFAVKVQSHSRGGRAVYRPDELCFRSDGKLICFSKFRERSGK